jgi:glycosyltransferase involved in cell wall biosynthesis
VGTPVIGAAMPALTEYVNDDNGALFAPGDWRELAACLRRIVDNPASTVDNWSAALQQPRTFAAIARDYLRLYEAA